MQALFVSIDGLDGCGKSTQIDLLMSALQRLGHSAEAVRDPGGTRLGEILREILLQRFDIPQSPRAEMLMYMASRAQLVEEIILPTLHSGRHIVSDRFLLANVAYQGSAGGLDPEEIWNVGAVATRGLQPDLTILLDIEPELAMSRMDGDLDRLESRGLEYMKKVREGFLLHGRRLGRSLILLDATKSIQEIHQSILSRVLEVLKDKQKE